MSFNSIPLATGDIGIAIDAEFTMASSQIVDEEVETEAEAERIAREEAEEGDLRQSIQRPQNEIKPGNPIYLRVTDLDRDISGEADEVMVKVTASSGDEAQVILRETGSHSGIFEGSVDSSDLPRGGTGHGHCNRTQSADGNRQRSCVSLGQSARWAHTEMVVC